MAKATLLFVGGPDDGRRLALNRPPDDRIRTLIVPPIEAPRNPVDGDTVSIDAEFFTYHTMSMPAPRNHAYWVAYPAEWSRDMNSSPTEIVVSELLRSYVGRSYRG